MRSNLARAGGQAERQRIRQRRPADDLAAARRRSRCRRVPPIRTDRAAALDYFSITLSHPRWLAARWYDRLGFDAAEAWHAVQQHAGAR